MSLAGLWWRANRRLLFVFAVVIVLTSIAGLVRAATVTCDPGMTASQCAYFRDSDGPSRYLTFILAVVPILLGLVLGIEAIGGELDGGTASFAWSVAPSRRRWLAEQLVPGLLASVAVGLVCGAVNAVIVAALHPGHYLPSSFLGYGLWGPILIVRGLAGYAIGLLLGLALGRVIAAVALGIVVVAIVVPAALIVGRSFEPARIVAATDPSEADALPVAGGYVGPNGEMSSSFTFTAPEPTFTNDPNNDKRNAWELGHTATWQSYLTGPQMPGVELRETTVLGLIAFASVGGAFALVANRRP